MSLNPEFTQDAARLERDWGIIMPYAQDYLPAEYRNNFQMAVDAQPALLTTPNAGIPAFFTQLVDPDIVRVLQTPNKGAEVLGEQKKGDWKDQTIFIPVLENTGVVSSYGDYNANGRSDVNEEWEQRQSYLFQTIIEYGDLEVDRAAAAKLSLVSEKQMAAAKTLDKFMDYCYHFGVSGLQCYGLTNDPLLATPSTPTTKAYGNVKWVTNNVVTALASEIYADFQMMFNQLASVSGGLIDADSAFTLVFPNNVAGAMTAVNSFGITIRAFIKESFPKVKFVVDPRYATAGGNLVQLISDEFDGKATGYCAFNEKMRDHMIVRNLSAYAQKRTAGTFGAIWRYPVAVASILGV